LSRVSGEQARPTGIAVFGSSEPVEGDPLYERAFRLGRLLAEHGHVIVTGGYGGVMEAASRGAHEAGGKTIGVTCRIFASRQPNPYLTEVRESEDLYDRTRALIGLARGFVILPGKAGTLAELSFLWALDRAGCLGRRRVVLLGDSFGAVLDQLGRSEMLDPEQIEITRIATSPQEVLDLLGRAPGETGASR